VTATSSPARLRAAGPVENASSRRLHLVGPVGRVLEDNDRGLGLGRLLRNPGSRPRRAPDSSPRASCHRRRPQLR
jgi:hypothetical protein